MNYSSSYIFILGSTSALSLAELHFIFSHASVPARIKYLFIGREFLVADLSVDCNEIARLFARFGGVVKIAKVFSAAPALAPELIAAQLPTGSEKTFFGISIYHEQRAYPSSNNTRKLGIAVKRLLMSAGASSRLVTSREPTLSSVVVRTNKLLSDRGAEILVIVLKNGTFIYGKTIYVQPYDLFALRDIGRPQRDARAGMLPPKLARMMVNIAIGSITAHAALLDPFCGSGTILQESLLAGVPRVCGSDLDADAVAHSRDNLHWLTTCEIWQLPRSATYEARVGDARLTHETFSHERFSAIVTEPYLGPPRTRPLHDREIAALKAELSGLYLEALSSCVKLLRHSGRVVMVWPFWRTERGIFAFLELTEACSRLGLMPVAPLPPELQPRLGVRDGHHASRQSLLYYREGQVVMREIRIFEKA